MARLTAPERPAHRLGDMVTRLEWQGLRTSTSSLHRIETGAVRDDRVVAAYEEALALAPHNIRVNAVGPGSIDTEMMASVNANPDAMKTAMSRTPLKRMGTPREIGDVVAFLAGAKSSYITGETIYVDGGRLGLNYTC